MVVPPATQKRLRVRLKASDPDTLAETFGANVFESGVFLKSKQLLPIGTAVLLELLYTDGALALRGRGRVESVATEPASGMNLALEWMDESVALARWLVARRKKPVSDPFEEVTVYAGQGPPDAWMGRRSLDVDVEQADEDHAPDPPTQPEAEDELVAPPAPVEVMLGQRIGSVHFLPVDSSPELSPPPVAPAEVLLGQRREPSDSWDLISDLLESPPPIKPTPKTDGPKSDLERAAMADAFEEPSAEDWGSTLYPRHDEAREPGEVTPLARIELVRTQSEELRTGDLEPIDPGEQEPRATAIPSKKTPSKLPLPSDAIMAIDFGTVNVRAAVPMRHEEPRIVESRRGSESTPSVVMIRDNGKTIVGEPALRKLSSHPQHGVLEARRLIGLPFSSERVQSAVPASWCPLVPGEEGEAAVRIGSFDISIEEIVALLLKEVRESALMTLEQKINRAVLTVPASFGFRQRDATRTAGKLAGIHVEGLVSEPVAIAVHATLERGDTKGRVFVYRLGGGTFDATVVAVDGDQYEVIGCEGDLLLGGVDFDAGLGSLIADEVARVSGLRAKDHPAAMVSVMEAARRAKHQLSEKGRAAVFVEPPANAEASFQIEVEVSREQAELIWKPLVDRTIEISARALAAAGLQPSDIDQVVLAGGQVRTPIVHRCVRELFGREPEAVDPEQAAALGAAQVAERLGTERKIRIRDRLSTSLFVAERESQPHLIMMHGAPLPAFASFTVRSPVSRTRTEIVLCEGAAEDSAEAIGVLRLEPFSGTAELKFQVSAEGLLSVSATDMGGRRPVRVELSMDLVRPYESSSQGGSQKSGLFGWIKKRFKTSRPVAEK